MLLAVLVVVVDDDDEEEEEEEDMMAARAGDTNLNSDLEIRTLELLPPILSNTTQKRKY
jgi:hypothetical protein